jgi:hypothetical protein
MDKEEVTQNPRPATFNGALEAGIRAVALLGSAYPRTYDLQRMVAFDYLLVHTDDIGGPVSLHPPAPLHTAELLVRRGVVESALMLMMTRDLIDRELSKQGIRYQAGENADSFLSCLQSDYLVGLKERAAWLVEHLGDRTDTEFRAVMTTFFDRWVEEFQSVEHSLGVDL